MNKRGQVGFEDSTFLYFEVVLGILFTAMLIFSASHFDMYSNVNKLYLEDDLVLLQDALLASPGSIEYTYEVANLYTIDENFDVVKTSGLIDAAQSYELIFTKEQGSSNLEVEKNV